MRGARAGLTLVELLVAMSLMGIIFALVTNWQTSTLSVSARTNALSQRLGELNDVTGYVGDRVRSALAVRTSGFTVNGGGCDATTPCLAVLVPEDRAEASGGSVVYNRQYLQLVYRVEPRSGWAATDPDKVADSWADDPANRVVILREYRARCVPTPTANCAPFLAGFKTTGAFVDMTPSLVADLLTSRDQAGGTITPFGYTYDPVARTGVVSLAFQGKHRARGITTFTPTTGPYTLQMLARNVQ